MEIVEKVIDVGVSVINFLDMVGYLVLVEYGNIFKYMKENVLNIYKVKFLVYCYDDLGMVVVNFFVVIENGVD